uniref:PH domain-containing protein n=1 Tax=Ciona savignyi TaxID=51511 RepID=H2YF78_CIOSA
FGNKDNPCKSFSPNIFNKNKCQNCFRPRETHLKSDKDLSKAKAVYGGWLLLAPIGTDFTNLMHKNRKWQRRWFVLFEHGALRYALDDNMSTVAQGTIDMNKCNDVIYSDAITDQKHSLCITLTEMKYYVRGESKEDIMGWHDNLVVYPDTIKNEKMMKKRFFKRKSEGPAKPHLEDRKPPLPTSPRLPRSRNDSNSSANSGIKSPLSERMSGFGSPTLTRAHRKDFEKAKISTKDLRSGSKNSEMPHASKALHHQPPVKSPTCPPRDPPTPSRPTHPTRPPYTPGSVHTSDYQIYFLQGTQTDQPTSRLDLRRAKSLDRKSYESIVLSLRHLSVSSVARSISNFSSLIFQQPDIFNIKKGWLTMFKDGAWQKHWFVLGDKVLRYYQNSTAEDRASVDGMIDLSSNADVEVIEVQRNYGFKIKLSNEELQLAAMTAGIRKNWIDAINKCSTPAGNDQDRTTQPLKVENNVRKQHSSYSGGVDDLSATERSQRRRARIRDRRREGRSRTFDFAEFR